MLKFIFKYLLLLSIFKSFKLIKKNKKQIMLTTLRYRFGCLSLRCLLVKFEVFNPFILKAMRHSLHTSFWWSIICPWYQTQMQNTVSAYMTSRVFSSYKLATCCTCTIPHIDSFTLLCSLHLTSDSLVGLLCSLTHQWQKNHNPQDQWWLLRCFQYFWYHRK